MDVTSGHWVIDKRDSTASGHEVRGHDGDEFAGSDYFGLLPERWEMTLVAGYQIIGAGCVCAFKELIIVGVFCNLKRTRGSNELRMILYELEELLPEAPADLEFRARKHLTVFRENGFADIQPGWFGERKEEHGALESVRFQGCRDQDVGIDDEAQRDHLRLVFWARAALITWSIRRALRRCVPLRWDSSPISLSTSGSGAASRT